jgi:hypothetical protein
MGIRYLRPHKVVGCKGLVVFQASKESARAELPSDFASHSTAALPGLTGGKPRLRGISQRANHYLRRQMIHGARRSQPVGEPRRSRPD